MKAPTRLGVYAAGLALVLAAGAGIGAAVGPLSAADDADQNHSIDAADETGASRGEARGHTDGTPPGANRATTDTPPTMDTAAATDAPATPATTAPTATPGSATELPAGLSSSDGGYTLAPVDTNFGATAPEAFRFQILGPTAAP